MSEAHHQSTFHVAVFMDGFCRWEKQSGRRPNTAIEVGARRLKGILRACPGLGVTHLTIGGFSPRNAGRYPEDLAGSMLLLRKITEPETRARIEPELAVRFIGDRSGLDRQLICLMEGLELEAASSTRLNLTVAVNYGGRDELVRAAKRLAHQVSVGHTNLEDLSGLPFDGLLDTYFLPDVDLMIHTGGRRKISNFLLWQSAYAEYEFVDTLWPDFAPEEFAEAVQRFPLRKRRFGGTSP